jgi:hypothetical protein
VEGGTTSTSPPAATPLATTSPASKPTQPCQPDSTSPSPTDVATPGNKPRRVFVAKCKPLVLAERVDPIVHPNKVNGHAHDIVGSSGISLSSHRADLNGASTCTFSGGFY